MYKGEKRISHSYKFNKALEQYLTKSVILYLPILGETEMKGSNPWFLDSLDWAEKLLYVFLSLSKMTTLVLCLVCVSAHKHCSPLTILISIREDNGWLLT